MCHSLCWGETGESRINFFLKGLFQFSHASTRIYICQDKLLIQFMWQVCSFVSTEKYLGWVMEDPELFWFCLSIHNSCKAQRKAKRQKEIWVKHRSKGLDYTRRVMTSCIWLLMSDGRWCCCSILLLYRSLCLQCLSPTVAMLLSIAGISMWWWALDTGILYAQWVPEHLFYPDEGRLSEMDQHQPVGRACRQPSNSGSTRVVCSF